MIRFFVVLLVVAGLLFGGRSTLAAEEDAPVAKTIEGKWRVVATTWYGKESKREIGLIWQFQGEDRFTMHFPGGRTLEGRYEIDTTKKPWHIDVETKEDQPELGGGGPRKGIASLDDGQLQLCVTGSAAASRPTEMVSKAGTLNILRILERVKQKR